MAGLQAAEASYVSASSLRSFRAHPYYLGRGAQGHGPAHILLTSAADVGFAWDGDEKGWFWAALPPLRTMMGPIQYFYSSVFDACRLRISVQLAEREEFRGAGFVDFTGSFKPLNSSHLRERDKM